MRSDRFEVFVDMRTQIAVPPVPLARIRTAAARSNAGVRPRRAGFIASLIAGAGVVVVTVGAGVWSEARILFPSSGGVKIVSDYTEFSMLPPPVEKVQAAVRAANFPVILPSGFPGSDRPTRMATFGKRAIYAIYLGYKIRDARPRSGIAFILSRADAMDSAQHPNGVVDAPFGGSFFTGTPPGGHRIIWKIGGESVLVLRGTATSAELSAIHRAMLAQAPR